VLAPVARTLLTGIDSVKVSTTFPTTNSSFASNTWWDSISALTRTLAASRPGFKPSTRKTKFFQNALELTGFCASTPNSCSEMLAMSMDAMSMPKLFCPLEKNTKQTLMSVTMSIMLLCASGGGGRRG
jgi:hypothetical protein